MVRNFISLLARSSIMVEKRTFEDVPVTGHLFARVVRYCRLPTLKSITIKRNNCRGCFGLFQALAIKLPPDEYDAKEHLLDINTYELPGKSVLETISFEPGLQRATNNVK